MDISMMENPELYIEALIFASEQSIRIEEIIYCLQAAFEHDFTTEEVNKLLINIKEKCYNINKMLFSII